MIYGSVCSGMEAASAAWAPLGWKCAFVSEIDKAPCALLKHRFPDVPNFGDTTKFKDWPDVSIDLLVGGTPCQSFSVAGLRKGLSDPRGSLMLTYGAIAQRYRPTWLLWENVPGVLSSNEGRDFGSFLGMLAELGYGFAYRVLDAQFCGLAQRRARVFVVGCLGDWRAPAAVLFERESLRGDPPPRRKAGEGVAPPIAGCANGGGANGPGRTADDAEALIPAVAKALAASDGGVDREDRHTLVLAFDARQSDVIQHGDKTGPLDTDGQSVGVVAFQEAQTGVREYESAGCLRANGPGHDPVGTRIRDGFAVRRLTPLECLRLQGFPDDYFDGVLYRGKPLADGPKYKMIGNSFAVPVVRWIGERIDLVRAAMKSEAA